MNTEKKMSKKLVWLALLQCARTFYTVTHYIIAPIFIVGFVVLNEFKGDTPHRSTMAMMVLVILLLTNKDVLEWYDKGRIEFGNQYESENLDNK
jgi:hypothetical protein